MIHSPRLHEGRLWWLNSGSGSSAWSIPWALGSRLLRSARAMRVASPALPHSVVDVSLARENRKFLGLPLDAALSSRGVEARCGLLMVNTRSGDIVEMLRLKGVKEQFDVAVPAGGGAQPVGDRLPDRGDPAADLDGRHDAGVTGIAVTVTVPLPGRSRGARLW